MLPSQARNSISEAIYFGAQKRVLGLAQAFKANRISVVKRKFAYPVQSFSCEQVFFGTRAISSSVSPLEHEMLASLQFAYNFTQRLGRLVKRLSRGACEVPEVCR